MSSPNITYTPDFYSAEKSFEIFNELQNYPFERPTIKIHGRTYNPLRQTCSYGDPDVSYAYSGHVEKPKPWTQLLLDLKADVERATGEIYNFVLLNKYESGNAKIGAHKDNEAELHPSALIPSLSFGATRNMIFSKKGEKSFYQPLENGSLLIMHDQTWYHSIPPQPKITEPRISLTFRKIVPFTTTAFKRKLEMDFDDSNKHMCDRLQVTCRNVFEPPHDIISDITPRSSETLPENDWMTQYVKNNDRVLKKISLGDDLVFSVQLFKNRVAIHIRQFYLSGPQDVRPSKNGVCFDLKTLFEFFQKIYAFSLVYSSESTVINNCILALVKENRLELRQFNDASLHPNSVYLEFEQLEKLKSQICEIEQFILDYLFCERLKEQVSEPTSYDSETSDESFKNLKTLVEKNLSSKMVSVYKCDGCLSRSQSQFSHSCMSESNYQKFCSLTDSVRILIDVDEVSGEFLKSNPKLSNEVLFNKLYCHLFENEIGSM